MTTLCYRRLLASSLALASSFSLVLNWQPALAQLNLGDINFSQLPSMLDFDTRRKNLEKKVSDALAAGNLTAQEAAPFTQDLARLQGVADDYRKAGRLSIFQRARLSLELDVLSTNIDKSMHNVQPVALTDIDGRIAEMSNSLNLALQAGRISTLDRSDFQKQLDAVSAKQAEYKKAGMTTTQTLELALQLDQTKKALDDLLKARTGADLDFAARRGELRARVDALQKTSAISTADAQLYLQELERIALRESQMRANGRVLTSEDQLSLALDLERVNANLARFGTTANTTATATATGAGSAITAADLPGRQTALANRLNSGRDGQRLSELQFNDLKNELDRIAARERIFRADGQLSDAELVSLGADLDLLNARIDKSLAPLPDLSAKKTEITQKIDNGLASGRLSSDDAQAVRADFNRAGQLEAAVRAGSASLTEQQTMIVYQQYQQVADRLNKALSPLPDLAAREAALLAKLNGAEAAGTLAGEQVKDLRKELARIQSVETSFRAGGANLNEWQTMSVARDLDKLESDMSRQLAAAPVAPPLSSAAVPFDTRGHWAESYVGQLTQRGIIGGFPDGSFKPDQGITRAQFAAIAVKALNLPAAGANATHFTDVPPTYWANAAIAAVSSAGLVTGFPDGRYKPEDRITRAQALIILAKALPAESGSGADTAILNSYGDGKNVPTWAAPAVARAARAHILVSYPDPSLINPNADASRADVAALTYQTLVQLGRSLPQIKVGLEK